MLIFLIVLLFSSFIFNFYLIRHMGHTSNTPEYLEADKWRQLLVIQAMTPSAFRSLSAPDRQQFIKDGGVLVDPEQIIKRARKAKAAQISTASFLASIDPSD